MIATNTIKASRGQASEKTRPVTRAPELAAALECARQACLLDDERTEHLSFRAPKALIEAAKRDSGIQSPTELGIFVLATLAQPDPVASFLKRTHASLGPGQKLDV
ncbi:hypothetical protein [Mesorhizobium sp. WSM3873]|uniref:hypothetical protein n=1 Tax=Mesorhizobium sp. WSM3873 TaxID=1854056 RepID=UPI000801571D|nr:hypothetical protein [Mesorhizobium sp. WSM3873]OBQ86519.1 hypothetical protein A9K71_17585 [Mesorhizobium sp. WSM3873]